MKNILLISPFFYPELISTGKYNTFLARALGGDNANVTVIASHPLYPKWVPEETNEQLPGITTIRAGKSIRYPKSNALRRIVLELWYAVYVVKEVYKRRKECDVLVSIFPPMLYSPIISKLIGKNVQNIVICHDLYGIMAKSNSGAVRRVIAGLMKAIEKYALKMSDKVICLSESMKKAIVNDYTVSASRCIVCYPFVTMQYEDSSSTELESLFENELFHIVYSGALGEKQIPDRLLEFFDKASSELDNVVFHVLSGGPAFERLKEKYISNNKIRFSGLVPEDELAELYKRSDIQVIPQAPGTGAGAFPSKIPNIIESGVPVFVMCDVGSELDEIIGESGAGVTVDVNKPELWIDSLVKAKDGLNGVSRKEYRASTQDFVRSKFSIDKLLEAINE